jgi:hypothetical protein
VTPYASHSGKRWTWSIKRGQPDAGHADFAPGEGSKRLRKLLPRLVRQAAVTTESQVSSVSSLLRLAQEPGRVAAADVSWKSRVANLRLQGKTLWLSGANTERTRWRFTVVQYGGRKSFAALHSLSAQTQYILYKAHRTAVPYAVPSLHVFWNRNKLLQFPLHKSIFS